MGDLARNVSELLAKADARIERPVVQDGDPDWYVGSGQAYQAALFRSGAEPCDLRTIIRDTAAYLASLESG